jgi:hypothetical protein
MMLSTAALSGPVRPFQKLRFTTPPLDESLPLELQPANVAAPKTTALTMAAPVRRTLMPRSSVVCSGLKWRQRGTSIASMQEIRCNVVEPFRHPVGAAPEQLRKRAVR